MVSVLKEYIPGFCGNVVCEGILQIGKRVVATPFLAITRCCLPEQKLQPLS